MQEKNVLRQALLEKRSKIPVRSRRLKSCRIFRRLTRILAFRNAEHVAFYYGIAPEVETEFFLKKVLRDKKLYLPRVELQKRLSLSRVRSLTKDLRKGAYHIREPRTVCEKRSVGKMDVIIVPGVAFDKNGGRLGRGGGYYDRLLKKARNVVKIGVCFREQIVKKIPMGKRDVKMDRVITD